MHEASIAQSIIEVIEERVAEGGIVGDVRKVFLQVGRLSTVVPDNLRFMYGVLVAGSTIEGSELEIESVPVRARCRACGAAFTIEDVCFLCAGCGSAELEVMSGRELVITAVEVS